MSEITITPLGTISPYLKDNMNCPGFLIEYNKEKILLDCGNGTTRLLEFPKCLNNLYTIITHYHKDHFGDIGMLQYASYVYHNLNLLETKVKVFMPENDFQFNKKSIISNSESYMDYIGIYDGFSFNIQDLNISFYNNKSHTIESYLVKLKNKDFTIIYTSDIGKTNFEDLINFCMDADLIICESSFLQKHQSTSKTHFTAYDAGILASKANVKSLLLTHFWPEEDKNSYLEEAKKAFENTIVAEESKKIILRKE